MLSACKLYSLQALSISVRTKGLEPPRRKTLDPKSSAATNYATCADHSLSELWFCKVKYTFWFNQTLGVFFVFFRPKVGRRLQISVFFCIFTRFFTT